MKNTTQHREEKVLRYIEDATKQKGYPPTVREICKAVGFKSTSTVNNYLKRLKEKGLITNMPLTPRSIRVKTERQDNVLEDKAATVTINLNGRSVHTINEFCKRRKCSIDEAIERALQLLAFVKR